MPYYKPEHIFSCHQCSNLQKEINLRYICSWWGGGECIDVSTILLSGEYCKNFRRNKEHGMTFADCKRFFLTDREMDNGCGYDCDIRYCNNDFSPK